MFAERAMKIRDVSNLRSFAQPPAETIQFEDTVDAIETVDMIT